LYCASGTPFSAATVNQRAASRVARRAAAALAVLGAEQGGGFRHAGLGGGGFELQAPRPVGTGAVEHPGEPETRPGVPGLGGALEVAGGEAGIARRAGQALLVNEAEAVGGARIAGLRGGAELAQVLAAVGVRVLLPLAGARRLLRTEGGGGGRAQLAGAVRLAHADGVAEDGAGRRAGRAAGEGGEKGGRRRQQEPGRDPHAPRHP
jgi:hypothetical protein